MKRIIPIVALIVATLPLLAADNTKRNTLTPKEIADGWILLFDGETTFGWKIDGEGEIQKGILQLGGEKETIAVTTTPFGDCEVVVQYERVAGKKAGELLRNGTRSTLLDNAGSGVIETSQGQDGNRSRDGLPAPKEGIGPPRTSPVGFAVPAGTKLAVHMMKLRPLGGKSLFNGKDLTGWKEHPGKKSKFAVKDGAITVKDGPGDLQTEGQWADFVLQLECFSNGKHLNSGIFFRCLPDQYQQGYESQIHNGWLSEPTKEYAVETFDIDTGKLTKTEKVKSAAMDYGTGAIYRRIPARKAVAKDGEWFTMTVAAQGRHIATWINGIQVVDWTDTRPVKDNARNGCKLEKGNISIQGHDPTTDLSFRNFRIVELPQSR